MEYIHKALEFLNTVPTEAYSSLIEIVVSAVVVSPLALGLKKWLEINSEKVMLAVVVFGSLVGSAVVYLSNVPEFGPWFVIVQGWLIFATTQPVYYLFVKPLYNRIGAWFTAQLVEAASIKAEQDKLRSAIEPAGGLSLVVENAGVVTAASASPVTPIEVHDFN